MLILRPAPCRPPAGEISPAADGRRRPRCCAPRACRKAASCRRRPPPATGPSRRSSSLGYGRRRPSGIDVDAEEYLHSLRSLGYV